MDSIKLKSRMDSALSFFEKELTSVRTARASSTMLDNLMVESYGTKTPINQLGNINVPDPNTITIQVWDTSLLNNIVNSIIESNLGINPQSDGSLIRLPIPKLSEERRLELSKIVSKYGESAKISVRNIRRDTLDELKTDEKEKIISQDELKKYSSEIQLITDEFIEKIDAIVLIKQKEITQV
jgi:ribosome recycling factor